jgi:hypothetical protein
VHAASGFLSKRQATEKRKYKLKSHCSNPAGVDDGNPGSMHPNFVPRTIHCRSQYFIYAAPPPVLMAAPAFQQGLFIFTAWNHTLTT